MKRIFLLLLPAILLFSACGDDDEGNQPDLVDELAYDGDNNTGPLLAPGYYEAAALFPADLVQQYTGRRLEAITFFIGQLPAGCEVKVYEGTDNGKPASLIFATDVTSGIVAPSWNRLALDPPITLAEDDIWLSIGLTHDQEQQSIGCDAGPNQPNGDWLFDDNDALWLPYTTRTPESINWNIRGELSN